MTGGKLCMSVIEAREVLAADTTSDLDFYVRLRLGAGEVKTNTSFGSISPKFLKDVRMSVPCPEQDVLRVDMLQLGPRGDLVVGSAEIPLASLVNKGTIVQWLELKAFNQAVGARLCCVLRYLSADASRPLTPSFAMAAWEARENALGEGSKSGLKAPGPAASKVLFSDDTPQPAAAVQAAQAAAPSRKEAVVAPAVAPSGKEAAVAAAAAAAAAAAVPAPRTPAASVTMPRTASLHREGGPVCSIPTQQAGTPPAAAAASNDGAADMKTTSADDNDKQGSDAESVSATDSVASETTAAAAAASVAPGRSRRWGGRGVRAARFRYSGPQVPPHLAAACGALVGILVYILKRRPPSGFDEQGLCLVSSCFNKHVYDKYQRGLEAGSW